MKRQFFTSLLMSIVLLAGKANAQANELKLQLENLVAQKNIPGMVVIIEQEGQIIFDQAIGYSNIEQKTPMSKDQRFRWFSMSKPVTAVAMLKTLHDQGLDVDVPLKTLYPNFDRDEKIPVSTIMNHTAGFGYGGEWNSFTGWLYWMFGPLERANSLPELMSKLDGIPLMSDPGEEFRYSMSSDVLGAIIQKVNGQRFDKYMHEKIFTPLKMTSTGFITKGMTDKTLAPFYRYDRESKSSIRVEDPTEWDKHVFSGGGGMTGTASDYMHFLRVLTNPAAYESFVAEDKLKQVVVNQLPANQPAIPETIYPKTGYGYGVGVKLEDEKYLNKNSYYWAGLAGTIFWVDPEKKLTVVAMTQLLGGRKAMEKSLVPMVYDWLETRQ